MFSRADLISIGIIVLIYALFLCVLQGQTHGAAGTEVVKVMLQPSYAIVALITALIAGIGSAYLSSRPGLFSTRDHLILVCYSLLAFILSALALHFTLYKVNIVKG
jgi:hypothetical protein